MKICWIHPNDALWSDAKSALQNSQFDQADYVLQLAAQNKLDHKQGLLLLMENEKILGFGALIKHVPLQDCKYSPFLYALYILPAHRNQGLAYRIVQAAINQEKQAGHHHLYLMSNHKNMLEQFGFSYIDELTSSDGCVMQIYESSF